MEQPLFLSPVFQAKIWGGQNLKTIFNYDIPSDHTGECWAISAHPNGTCIVENGPYQGKKLDELWKNNRELFGNAKGDVFPLLTKILDAADDLSVQVHPDDSYGLQHAGELGKTECWYVIDAAPGSEIIYGHHAKTKAELADMIAKDEWDKLLRRIPVKKGDFFYVPSGTIHAIGKNIMILETQQSSDTTYRVFDYHRLGDDGKERELHIQESLDVTTIPHVDPKIESQCMSQDSSKITTFVQTPFFSVYDWLVAGTLRLEQKSQYTLVSVLEGEGTLFVENPDDPSKPDSYPVSKGIHFILPNTISSWRFEGNLHMIASEPGKLA